MAPITIRFTQIQTMYNFIHDNPEKFKQMWINSSIYPDKQEMMTRFGLTQVDFDSNYDTWLSFCLNYYKPDYYGRILPNESAHNINIESDIISVTIFMNENDSLIKKSLHIKEEDIDLYSFTYL